MKQRLLAIQAQAQLAEDAEAHSPVRRVKSAQAMRTVYNQNSDLETNTVRPRLDKQLYQSSQNLEVIEEQDVESPLAKSPLSK